MSRLSLLSATAVLSALALASCGGETTQPNPVEGTVLRPPEAAVSSGTWTKKRLLWPPRYLMAAGTVNNTIYVAGGYSSVEWPTARVDAYNVATNTWSRVKSLPTPAGQPYGLSAINGRLYLAGGRPEESGGASRDLFEYTPATDTWVRKRPLPASVSPTRAICIGGAQGAIGGKLYIYVPCGDAPGGRLLRYNPVTDTYVWLPGPPNGHVSGGAGVINGKFYLAGGIGATAAANRQLHVYDPATNAWTTKAPMPTRRFRDASAVLNGKLFLAGGDKTFIWYDPATNTWSEGPPMPTPRSGAAGASAGGSFYVIGGSDSTFALRAKVEAYTP